MIVRNGTVKQSHFIDALWRSGENVVGPHHPTVGIALNNLAGTYSAQGKFTEAETLYNRDLANTMRRLVPTIPMRPRRSTILDILRPDARTGRAPPSISHAGHRSPSNSSALGAGGARPTANGRNDDGSGEDE